MLLMTWFRPSTYTQAWASEHVTLTLSGTVHPWNLPIRSIPLPPLVFPVSNIGQRRLARDDHSRQSAPTGRLVQQCGQVTRIGHPCWCSDVGWLDDVEDSGGFSLGARYLVPSVHIHTAVADPNSKYKFTVNTVHASASLLGKVLNVSAV